METLHAAPTPYMNLSEARTILGLGPEDDPRTHLEEFKGAREKIAELVRNSPNPVLADRYQQGLVDFDKALAAVHEFIGEQGLERQTGAQPAKSIEDEETPTVAAPRSTQRLEVAEDDSLEEPERGSRAVSFLTWSLVFLIGAVGGAWLYYRHEESLAINRQTRIALLERIGSQYLENRRWQEATEAFDEIEKLMPGSDLAAMGRRSIEAGMGEEQTQFVGYWTGQAIAELDVGRVAEAQAAIDQITKRYPDQAEVKPILQRIDQARSVADKATAIANTRTLINERRWNDAVLAAKELLDKHPQSSEIKTLLTDAEAGLTDYKADQAKAGRLLAMAELRDKGQFDQQALDWLREAAALAPDNTEIAKRLEKMAAYTRTIRVPGDFSTPQQAIEAARSSDRVLLGEKTWKGPLVINAAIELQGSGSGKTFIESPATEACSITIGPLAKGARINGITFRHESFHAEGGERFSAALVMGGSCAFIDCQFTGASGHGLAVVEGGEAFASRCVFADNAWNGVAAIGAGATLEVRDSEARDNFHNGIESWDGASVTLVSNRCLGNSRNGIHTDNGAGIAVIEGNRLLANREFGLLLSSAATGRATGNIIRSNLLGGMVVRKAASTMTLNSNQVTQNEGPGLTLEKGVPADALTTNQVEKNKGRDLAPDTEL